jgi:hypothetical protein
MGLSYSRSYSRGESSIPIGDVGNSEINLRITQEQ